MTIPALIECPDCHRHIYANADGCPFCTADTRRVKIVAVAAAVGLAVSLTMMGCAYGAPPPQDSGGGDAVADTNSGQ